MYASKGRKEYIKKPICVRNIECVLLFVKRIVPWEYGINFKM